MSYEVDKDGNIYETTRKEVDLVEFLKQQARTVLDARLQIENTREELNQIILQNEARINQAREYLIAVENRITDEFLEQISGDEKLIELLTKAFPEVFSE